MPLPIRAPSSIRGRAMPGLSRLGRRRVVFSEAEHHPDLLRLYLVNTGVEQQGGGTENGEEQQFLRRHLRPERVPDV